MTDDNEKTTQTSSQSGQRPRFKPQLGHDFIPPSLQDKGVSPRARRRLPSESETETETETESETESETDEYGQSQSMVVMDARKPQAPNLAVRKQKTPRTPRTPTTPKTPKSGREFETPRQRGVSIVRNGREYVEVEDDGTTSTDREVVAPHPGASMSFEKPRKRRRNMAIIEVQDAVELDAKRNETSMEEERQVAVPAVTKDSMRQIDEGQVSYIEGYACTDPEGGGGAGGPHPQEKSQNIGFLSNTGLDPLKNLKATKPAFNVGPSLARQRNAISMVFRWQADDGLLIVVNVFGSSLPSSTKKKTIKKKIVKSFKNNSLHVLNNKFGHQLIDSKF